MKFIRSAWKSIRRNPVLNAFAFALVAQIGHDFFANQIDWTNITLYLGTTLLAVATREFTVPTNEHDKAISEAYMRGLVIPHATPGDVNE